MPCRRYCEKSEPLHFSQASIPNQSQLQTETSDRVFPQNQVKCKKNISQFPRENPLQRVLHFLKEPEPWSSCRLADIERPPCWTWWHLLELEKYPSWMNWMPESGTATVASLGDFAARPPDARGNSRCSKKFQSSVILWFSSFSRQSHGDRSGVKQSYDRARLPLSCGINQMYIFHIYAELWMKSSYERSFISRL